MTGALAVTALGIALVGRTAEAAPGSVSPFAGAYAGTGPITPTLVMQVDIFDTGRVTGAAAWKAFGLTGKYRLSGNVTADGAFSYRVDYSVTGHSKGFFTDAGGATTESLGADGTTTTYGTAQLVKNADGSVTSVSGTGEPIVWNLR
jgi:hypothetical protein